MDYVTWLFILGVNTSSAHVQHHQMDFLSSRLTRRVGTLYKHLCVHVIIIMRALQLTRKIRSRKLYSRAVNGLTRVCDMLPRREIRRIFN